MLANLVLWCITLSQSACRKVGLLFSIYVLRRNEIVVFKVKVTANFNMLMNVCPDDTFWIAEPFITKLCMVMHYHEPDCLPTRFVCCLQGQAHSEGSCDQNLSFWYIFWAVDPFAVKLAAHHHKLDCFVKRLVCCFQGQGDNKSSYDENMTVSTIFSELLILWCQTFFIVHCHKPECFLKKVDCCGLDYDIQGQGHSRGSKCHCLSRGYLLNR